MKISTRKLASAAVVGAAYAALTLLLAPISFGLVQLRVSETLCILPAFLPCTAWGLWAGCAIANLAGGYGLPDIVFGSLATLGASLSMAAIAKGRSQPLRLGRALAVCLMPVVWNGPIVGAVIAYSTGAFWSALALSAAQIAAEEAVVMYVIGLPLLKLLPRSAAFRRAAESLG